MPYVTLPDGAKLHYRVDDFTDPWTTPETVVLLHGYVRNSNFWYAWVPVLARYFRIVRPDLRGCGLSPPPAEGFQWSLAQYHDDLIAFLQLQRRHHRRGKADSQTVAPLRDLHDSLG